MVSTPKGGPTFKVGAWRRMIWLSSVALAGVLVLGVVLRIDQAALAVAIDVQDVDPARILDYAVRLQREPHAIVLAHGIAGIERIGGGHGNEHELVEVRLGRSGDGIVRQLQPAMHLGQASRSRCRGSRPRWRRWQRRRPATQSLRTG